MFGNVIAWYARRIVNVNINIVLAGVLALVPVLGVVRIAQHLLATPRFQNGVLYEKLEAHHQLVITAVTFFADVIFDVGIYFVLHWLANHAPKKTLPVGVEQRMERVADAAADHVPFFKDAAKVQLQRAVLSPLLYFLWLGIQFVGMNVYGLTAVWATVLGFCVAIGTVRTLHTFWMLREERAHCAVSEGRVCGKCGYDLRATPAEISGTCPECGKEFRRPVKVAPAALPHATTSNGASAKGAAQSLSENGEKSVSRS